MWIETLFFVVFGMQVFLMSRYYPKRILNRMDYIFKNYPIETYSKLYPDGYEKALKGKIVFSLISNAIFALGVLLIAALLIFVFKGEASLHKFGFVPLAFGMFQAIPLFMLELSGLKAFKKMRILNTDTKRSAELNPRGLFNFVSPFRLALTILLFFTCIFIVLKLNGFNMGEEQAILIGSMCLANSLFIALGYRLIHGKKMDPHQSTEDRYKTTSVVILSYTSISMLISVFFVFSISSNVLSLEMWEPIFNSLYWLGVMYLSTGSALKYVNVEDINYEVYKTSSTD
jgi:hypothetical protein